MLHCLTAAAVNYKNLCNEIIKYMVYLDQTVFLMTYSIYIYIFICFVYIFVYSHGYQCVFPLVYSENRSVLPECFRVYWWTRNVAPSGGWERSMIYLGDYIVDAWKLSCPSTSEPIWNSHDGSGCARFTLRRVISTFTSDVPVRVSGKWRGLAACLVTCLYALSFLTGRLDGATLTPLSAETGTTYTARDGLRALWEVRDVLLLSPHIGGKRL